jgi:predicted amino acid-binding ACT domain protein
MRASTMRVTLGGMAMNGFLISTSDRPGVAAELFEATARRGVNVFPAYGLADGTTGLICVGSEDESGLRQAIADADLAATELELVTTVLQNRPGAGADLFRRLADAGINLMVAVPTGMGGDEVELALGASDPTALRRALEG